VDKTFHLALFVLIGGITIPAMHASSTAPPKLFETAAILSVHKQQLYEPPYYGGDNPSDAPLQSEVFAYEVAVRTTCGTYVARYETPYDFLPSAFAANRQMPVKVGKHKISFDLGYRQMQMPIERSKKDKDANCR